MGTKPIDFYPKTDTFKQVLCERNVVWMLFTGFVFLLSQNRMNHFVEHLTFRLRDSCSHRCHVIWQPVKTDFVWMPPLRDSFNLGFLILLIGSLNAWIKSIKSLTERRFLTELYSRRYRRFKLFTYNDTNITSTSIVPCCGKTNLASGTCMYGC